MGGAGHVGGGVPGAKPPRGAPTFPGAVSQAGGGSSHGAALPAQPRPRDAVRHRLKVMFPSAALEPPLPQIGGAETRAGTEVSH